MDLESEIRLATYGTLGPGRSNHHQLSGLNGKWTRGTVRGKRVVKGWGAAQGYPGLILDPKGEIIEVDLFLSEELPEHWDRLDTFEGDEYRRVLTDVSTPEGTVEAYIYVIAAPT